MRTIATLLVGAGLMFGAAAKQTFNGVITDTMCGADHSQMGVKPDSKCVRECVKQGSKYALLVGANVYTLSDQKTPDKYAGEKVQVTGTLDTATNTITVDKIQAAK
jgi:hypothetical protein